MKMQEMIPALGMTEEHEKTMDELVPGWRENTPIEFASRMEHVGSKLIAESTALQHTLDVLDKTRYAQEDEE